MSSQSKQNEKSKTNRDKNWGKRCGHSISFSLIGEYKGMLPNISRDQKLRGFTRGYTFITKTIQSKLSTTGRVKDK
jgi:hypothetical protein